MRRTPLAMIAIALLLPLAACVSRTPAAFGRNGAAAPPTADLAWPERPDEPTLLDVQRGREHLSLIDHGRHGEGILYELRVNRTDTPIEFEFDIVSEVTQRSMLTGTWKLGPEDADDDAERHAYLFTSQQIEVSFEFVSMFFAFSRWRADPTLMYRVVPNVREPRGTVLFMASLGGATPGERALIDEFVDRGWCVLWTSPSLAGLDQPAFPVPAKTESSNGFDRTVTSYANRIDQNLAERAYAMEAFVEFTHETHPQLRSRPIVAVGCSAGAIALPTTAARLRGSIDAAVLIAGGANLFRIATHSTLLGDQIQVRIDDRPATSAELDALEGRILAAARLDPYHTARTLSHTPVLMLHASNDRIVPADTGDLLYERLEQPERWTFSPLGHIGLFVVLPSQAVAIADWVEDAAPTRSAHMAAR